MLDGLIQTLYFEVASVCFHNLIHSALEILIVEHEYGISVASSEHVDP
jgi:hypothetical protein